MQICRVTITLFCVQQDMVKVTHFLKKNIFLFYSSLKVYLRAVSLQSSNAEECFRRSGVLRVSTSLTFTGVTTVSTCAGFHLVTPWLFGGLLECSAILFKSHPWLTAIKSCFLKRLYVFKSMSFTFSKKKGINICSTMCLLYLVGMCCSHMPVPKTP